MKKIGLGIKSFVLFLFFISTSVYTNAQGSKEIKERQKEIKALPSQGITGVVHEKNLNKVVFDTLPISDEKKNSSSLMLKTKFETNQQIFARIYTSKPIVTNFFKDGSVNLYGDNLCEFAVYYTINGDEQMLTYDQAFKAINDEGKYITTFQADILNFSSKNTNSKQSQFIKKLNALPNGEHKIKIEVYGGASRRTELPLAAGEFTYLKKQNAKTGVFFDKIEEHKSSDETTKKIILDFLNKQGYKEKYTKVRIVNDWEVVRNNSGIKTSRKRYFVAYSKKDNGTCFYKYFYFFQNWLNGDKYEEASSISDGWPYVIEKDCDCSN